MLRVFLKTVLGINIPEETQLGYKRRTCGCIEYENYHLGMDPCFIHSEGCFVLILIVLLTILFVGASLLGHCLR